VIAPTLDVERGWIASGVSHVAGMDEVGRGALAGPVSVGVVLVGADTGEIPAGLADSKLLQARVRESLVPHIAAWCVASAIGHASPAEIDSLGIIGALRLAGTRALRALPIVPDVVILDGSHNWLTREQDLFDADAPAVQRVQMLVKADQICASVAAASVLAKVERDGLMCDLDAAVPGYAFATHKGYGSDLHRQAIRTLGASDAHRRSWRLG